MSYTTGAPDVPICRLAEQLLHTAKVENFAPDHWEILFGEGVLEALAASGRANMRTVTGLKRIYDLPVAFPEKPGPRSLIMELRLLSDNGGAQAGIHVEYLLGVAHSTISVSNGATLYGSVTCLRPRSDG